MTPIPKAEAIRRALATETFVVDEFEVITEQEKRIARLTGLQQLLPDKSTLNISPMDDGDDLRHGDDPVL